jgi:hypothetical protein
LPTPQGHSCVKTLWFKPERNTPNKRETIRTTYGNSIPQHTQLSRTPEHLPIKDRIVALPARENRRGLPVILRPGPVRIVGVGPGRIVVHGGCVDGVQPAPDDAVSQSNQPADRRLGAVGVGGECFGGVSRDDVQAAIEDAPPVVPDVVDGGLAVSVDVLCDGGDDVAGLDEPVVEVSACARAQTARCADLSHGDKGLVGIRVELVDVAVADCVCDVDEVGVRILDAFVVGVDRVGVFIVDEGASATA